MNIKEEPSSYNCGIAPTTKSHENLTKEENPIVYEATVKQEIDENFQDYNLINIKKEELDIKDEVLLVAGNSGFDQRLQGADNKPLACDVCGLKMTLKRNLTRHMRTHIRKKLANNTQFSRGEKPFVCPFCDYGTALRSDLVNHITIHSGEKPFACYVCSYRTALKERLTCHVKIHSGEKSFPCNVCDYGTNYEANLKRHLIVHTGEKPFACGICDFRTSYKKSLQCHMKKIHDEEKD